MMQSHGYAVPDSKARLGPFSFERRELKPADVKIDIQFCGICHSDIHQVRGEWGNSTYPMVPGHEIVGTVSAVGSAVKKFRVAIWPASAAWSTVAGPAPTAGRGWSSTATTTSRSRTTAPMPTAR